MKFAYLAKDSRGNNVKGTVEAISMQAAAETLRGQKLMPMNFKAVSKNSLADINDMFSRVGAGDITNFTRQLATMINSGLPLTDALALLKTLSSPALSKIVGEILNDVQSGTALSTALSKHPREFPKVYVALVKAGEAAGVMETILNRLADNLEKSREFRAKVVGAMIYPIIIVVGMIGVMVLMMVVVIPQLTALYADFDAELPFMTRMLIAVSNFMVNYWWAVIAGAGGMVWGIRKILATKSGRMKWDRFYYKIPVIGPLGMEVMLTELTRTMGLLVGSGVSVIESLNIVADAMGNVVIEQDLKRIAKQVEKGFPLSISFSESGLFPDVIGQMVAVGEETGKLDDVMSKLSHYFETESDEKVKGLTSAIEPIILIVLAVGVGFLMYAVVMPIYTITDKI